MSLEEINRKLFDLLSKNDADYENLIGGYEKNIAVEYAKALKIIKNKIAAIYEKYGSDVSHADMSIYGRLTGLYDSIAVELTKLTKKNIPLISEAIKECFSSAYYAAGHAVETSLSIKAGFGLLNPDVIKASVLNPLDYITWGDRYKGHIQELNNAIRQEVTQGLIQGKGYGSIASAITDRANIAVSKATLIARTESGRAQSAGRNLSFDKSEMAAEKLGLRTVRVWMSTHDGRTRDQHFKMDKQESKIIDGKPKFKFPDGTTTEGPRLSGIAKQDINCRCADILQVTTKSSSLYVDRSKYKEVPLKDWKIQKGIK